MSRILGVLALSLLATLGMAPQANAAFTTAECEGASVLGRGASFAQAAHGAWEFSFRNIFCNDGPNITYDPAGSGAGRTAMALRDSSAPRFGGTDDPLTASQKNTINAGDALDPNDDGEIHQVPAAVGAVSVIVNFPNGCDATLLDAADRTDAAGTGDDNVARARFTKDTLEKIFAKEAGFDRWDDVFTELQADADCDKPIVRVVRFDNSGTTFAFKDFLHRVNGARGWLTTYQTGTNGNREWPNATFGGTGQCGATSAPGNGDDAVDQLTSACANGAENLVAKMNTTDGSIGYADLASARTAVPTFAVNATGSTPPDKTGRRSRTAPAAGRSRPPTPWASPPPATAARTAPRRSSSRSAARRSATGRRPAASTRRPATASAP